MVPLAVVRGGLDNTHDRVAFQPPCPDAVHVIARLTSIGGRVGDVYAIRWVAVRKRVIGWGGACL